MEGKGKRRSTAYSQLITFVLAVGFLHTVQGNICSTQQESSDDKIFVYLTVPDGHGCECDVTVRNTSGTVYVDAVVDEFIVTEEGEEGRCVPFMTMAYDRNLQSSNEMINFFCAHEEEHAPSKAPGGYGMDSNSRLRLTLFNDDPPRRLQGNMFVELIKGHGTVSVTCKTATPAYTYDICPCLESKNGTAVIYPGATAADKSDLNKKLTAGFVSAVIFLIIVALLAIAYYYFKRKRDRDAERNTGIEGTGAENKAYHASKSSIPDNQKNKFTPDPDLNLNLASTPSGSMGNNMDPQMRNSHDSGLYSMQRPTGPNHSYDNMNPYGAREPQGYHPAQRPVRPEEMEAMSARSHRRADSPPPDTFPRSARSQEQLNNDYVTAELRAPSEASSIHNASHSNVETEI